MEWSDLPVARVALARLRLDHLLKLAALHVDGSVSPGLLFLFGLFLEHLDLVFQTGEDETDHRGAAVESATCVHPLVEGSNLGLIALELHALCVTWHLLPLDQGHLNLLRELVARAWHGDIL